MKRNTCPFLGLKDDPQTALNFPSVGNFCHHAVPVTQVKGAYQQKYCLNGEHINCPLFQAAQPLPPSAAVSATAGLLATPRRRWMVLGVPALLVSSAAFFLAWNVVSAQLNLVRGTIPDTGQPTPSSATFSFVGAGAGPKPAALAPGYTPSPTQEPSPTACIRPNGWVDYTVSPTDSVYRLSMVYGVSIEELQKVNCLGDNTFLKPGDIIFVPELPTETPTPKPSPTPIPPTSTRVPVQVDPVQPAPANNDSGDNAAPPPPQPTAVPPTAVPAQPQPTAEPQQPEQPPAQKPPEQKPPEQKPPEKPHHRNDNNPPSGNPNPPPQNNNQGGNGGNPGNNGNGNGNGGNGNNNGNGRHRGGRGG